MVRITAVLAGMALAACSPVGAAQDAPPAPAASETAPAVSEAGLKLADVTVRKRLLRQGHSRVNTGELVLSRDREVSQ